MAYIAGPTYLDVGYQNLIKAAKAHFRKEAGQKCDPMGHFSNYFFTRIFKRTETRRIFNAEFDLIEVLSQLTKTSLDVQLDDRFTEQNVATFFMLLIDFKYVFEYMKAFNLSYKMNKKLVAYIEKKLTLLEDIWFPFLSAVDANTEKNIFYSEIYGKKQEHIPLFLQEFHYRTQQSCRIEA